MKAHWRRIQHAAAAAAIFAATSTKYSQKQKQRCHWYQSVYWYKWRHFSLRHWDDAKICFLCCFSKTEIQQLLPLLQLEKIQWTARNHSSMKTALCLLLCQLTYSEWLMVIADHFNCSPSWCSLVFNDVAVHLWTTFRGILEWHPLLNYEKMAHYAEAISDLIESRDGCEPPGFVTGEGSAVFWGFVDGTFWGFCRPTGYEQQRSTYSGHKKDNGQKWQAVVTPDGLVLSLIGPFLGPVNDWAIWRRSQLTERIQEIMKGNPTLYLYEDPSYKHSYGIIAPFQHSRGWFALEPWQQKTNERLSSARITVEHAFGHTQVLWTYTAYGKGLRAGSSPVAAYFAAAILFTNCLTCIQGNQTSQQFVIDPPSLEQYLLTD